MHVGLGHVRQIEVDHVRDDDRCRCRARRCRSRPARAISPRLEARQRPLARVLRLVAVNRIGARRPRCSRYSATRLAACLVRVKTSARVIAASASTCASSAALVRLLDEDRHDCSTVSDRRRHRRHRHRRRIVQQLVGEALALRAAWSPRRTASAAWPAGARSRARTSWMKPMSSMRSASSSTKISSFAEMHAVAAEMRSSRRPGVATRMSMPARSARSCCALPDAAEDHRVAHSRGACRTSPKLSSICAASSRVGVEHQHRDGAIARAGAVRSWPAAAASAARTPRSCRYRSGRGPADRARRARAEWPGLEWGSVACSPAHARRAREAR